jgi:hypothetical protein
MSILSIYLSKNNQVIDDWTKPRNNTCEIIEDIPFRIKQFHQIL